MKRPCFIDPGKPNPHSSITTCVIYLNRVVQEQEQNRSHNIIPFSLHDLNHIAATFSKSACRTSRLFIPN